MKNRLLDFERDTEFTMHALSPTRCSQKLFRVVLLLILLLPFPSDVRALTVQQIMKENATRYSMESFRVGVDITTLKGKKNVSRHFLWVMGMTEQGTTSLFVEFDEPEEARGMRFLFKYPAQESSSANKAFVFMPATRVAVPLKAGDSPDIGGTGMTAEDFRGFVPDPDGELTLEREENVDGRNCYVILVSDASGKPVKRIWIAKEQFMVVKTETLGADGSLERQFRVTEFFTAQDGKMWPRKEEIFVPKDGIRVIVDQQGGVYNVSVPEELFDPATFGTFKWRIAIR